MTPAELQDAKRSAKWCGTGTKEAQDIEDNILRRFSVRQEGSALIQDVVVEVFGVYGELSQSRKQQVLEKMQKWINEELAKL